MQETLAWLNRIKLLDPRIDELKEQFVNDRYKLFRKLDFNAARGRREHEFKNWSEFQQIKEQEIREAFVLTSLSEFDALRDAYFEMIELGNNEQYNLQNGLGIVIDENIKLNPALGFDILKTIMEDVRFEGFVPGRAIARCTESPHLRDPFWKLIRPVNRVVRFFMSLFAQKKTQIEATELWRLAFLQELPDDAVTPRRVKSLLNQIRNLSRPQTLHLNNLEKFIAVKKDFISRLARIIIGKNERGKVKLAVFDEFISRRGDSIPVRDLKKFYLQQDHLQQHFDFEGQAMLTVLKRDRDFLLEYLHSIPKDNIYKRSEDYRQLSIVWNLDNPDELVERALLAITNQEDLGLHGEFMAAFFTNLPPERRVKSDAFLLSFIQRHSKETEKMAAVFNMISVKYHDLFNQAFRIYIKQNPDLEDFKRIDWPKDGVIIHDGNANMGDLQASRWQGILTLLASCDLGLNEIPLKNWIQANIDADLRWAETIRKGKYRRRR